MNLFSKSFFIACLGLFIFVPKGICQSTVAGDTLLTQVNKKFLLAIHITVDSLGNLSAPDTAAIRQGIRSTNKYFAPIGLSFDVGEFYYIDNYQYDLISDPREMGEAGSMYDKPNRINVYLITNFLEDLAGLCGVAGGNIFILASCANGTGLAHEIGHFLGLPHTHGGASHVGEDSTVSVGELADGSNCKTAGDGFCDTPADPFGQDPKPYIEDCAFIFEGKDANGDYYEPDLENIMSFHRPECGCEFHFSNEQLEAMARAVLPNPMDW